jgi:hypothetical protein
MYRRIRGSRGASIVTLGGAVTTGKDWRPLRFKSSRARQFPEASQVLTCGAFHFGAVSALGFKAAGKGFWAVSFPGNNKHFGMCQRASSRSHPSLKGCGSLMVRPVGGLASRDPPNLKPIVELPK